MQVLYASGCLLRYVSRHLGLNICSKISHFIILTNCDAHCERTRGNSTALSQSAQEYLEK